MSPTRCEWSVCGWRRRSSDLESVRRGRRRTQLQDDLKKREDTRLHSVENSIWNCLWTCYKADCGMNLYAILRTALRLPARFGDCLVCPTYMRYLNICKGKAVPLQVCSGPEGSRKLRFSDFMTTQPYPPAAFTPRNCSWYSLLEAESATGP